VAGSSELLAGATLAMGTTGEATVPMAADVDGGVGLAAGVTSPVRAAAGDGIELRDATRGWRSTAISTSKSSRSRSRTSTALRDLMPIVEGNLHTSPGSVISAAWKAVVAEWTENLRGLREIRRDDAETAASVIQ
jgi:hypothetical protein